MRSVSKNGGFSLVELLTVIAIIAILAAIIFPVMSTVKQRANESKCMSNLQQIGQAVAMFKQDNRRYPEILGSYVVSGQPFENAKDKYLFPEYVKGSMAIFHCPSSKVASSSEVMQLLQVSGTSTRAVELYAYDSYDAAVLGGTSPYSELNGFAETHYRNAWVPKTNLQDGLDWILDTSGGSQCLPYPPTVSDSPAVAQIDYERQLKWRNPPGDTLITWCSYHEVREGNDPSKWRGNALAVFLDGHVDRFPANEMEQCKWRIRTKK